MLENIVFLGNTFCYMRWADLRNQRSIFHDQVDRMLHDTDLWLCQKKLEYWIKPGYEI